MAKEKLSGSIRLSSSPKNKKIVFDEDSEIDDQDVTADEPEQAGGDTDDELGEDNNGRQHAEADGDDDDDAVEEVSGSAARESTKKLRKAERTIATDTQSRKKRKRKETKPPLPTENGAEDEESDDQEELLMTEDFFKQVDSEQKDEKIKSKRDKKERRQKIQTAQGKHTTFVVDNDYSMAEAQRKGKNIEVVALGGPVDDADEAASTDDEQELILSATMGSQPSNTALAFARDNMIGTSMKRSCESRKRRSKDDEGWTRGRAKLGKPGQPAAVFVRR